MDFRSVSRQRTRLMGFAMLWVVYFHMTIRQNPGALVYFIHRIGYYGVDLFLLVSGMGLWRSLSKNDAVLPFYGRRALRIFPAYAIVLCVWYAFRRVSPGAFALSLSTVGYWLQLEHFDWFIPTLIVYYLFAPLVYRAVRRSGDSLLPVAVAFVLSAVLCVIGYFANLLGLYGSFVRIPVFVLGFWFGAQSDKDEPRKIGGWKICLAIIAGLAAAFIANRERFGNVVQAGLNAYPALICMPAMALLLGAGFDRIDKHWGRFGKIVTAPFAFFGKYSLEIYLLHGSMMQLFPQWGQKAALLVSFLLAFVLHEAIALVLKACKRPGN
ncbi:MAG: acyltransferase [Clostridia bacterium]|nr:acyltransferase [Clostridia bacterium]